MAVNYFYPHLYVIRKGDVNETHNSSCHRGTTRLSFTNNLSSLERAVFFHISKNKKELSRYT